jgi:AraC-like DNA-binding protein
MHATPPVRLPFSQWNLLSAHLNWIGEWGIKTKDYHQSFKKTSHYGAIWIQKGHVEFRSGAQTITAGAGEWLFHQPISFPCSFTYSTDCHRLTLGFTMNWQGEGKLLSMNRSKLWKTGPLPELEEKSHQLHQSVLQYLKGEGGWWIQKYHADMETYLSLHHQFTEWLLIWTREMNQNHHGWIYSKNMDDRVARAITYMESSTPDTPVRVDDMARSLGVCPRQLTRLFQQQYGMAPKTYWMKHKLQLAVRELQSTRDEIKGIATRFGYNRIWFTAWIKKETGKTPSELRSRRTED